MHAGSSHPSFCYNPPPSVSLQRQMVNSYDARHSAAPSSAPSSTPWANPCPRRGRLLYAPLILVEEEDGSPAWARGGEEGKKGVAGRGTPAGATGAVAA